MQYVSQRDVEALAAETRIEAAAIRSEVATERRRASEASRFFREVVGALAISVCVVLYLGWMRLQALRRLYKGEVDWFRTRYTRGPRPKGPDDVSLTCLLLSAEYPRFAQTFLGGTCESLPQTSAIFLNTMIQNFGSRMIGIHYAGSRAQLRGDQFRTFLRDFSHWDVASNPWRFLFPTKQTFNLSVSVRAAKKDTQGGATMLEQLYNGGLCHVARQFYSPDVTATQMCHRLLDQELVYYQSCQAVRLQQAESVGGTYGGAGASVAYAARGAIGRGITATRGMMFGTTATEATEATGEAAAVAETVSTVAEAAESVVAASAAGGPVAFLAALAVTSLVCVAGTLIGTLINFAAAPCPYDKYYTLVRTEGGAYYKKPWHGNDHAVDEKSKKPKPQ